MLKIQKAKPLPLVNNNPKWLQQVASVISYIFHPVFMPLVMAYVLSKLDLSFALLKPKDVAMWFLSIIITGVFFPLFSVALMKPLGFIDSFQMRTSKERTIPLMATMIFYFWLTHVFNTIQGPPLIWKVLLLGNFWGIILLFMANIFTKVSMHTAAAGGMVGILLVFLIMSPGHSAIIPLIIAIIVAIIIGAARTILNVHQRGDIWLGYIIGIVVQLGAYIYMK